MNPWFELDSADATGAPGSTADEGSSQSSTEVDPSAASAESSEASTSAIETTPGDVTASETDSDAPDDTGPLDTGTDGSDSESGPETTGGPSVEGALYYDLWDLCATGSQWKSEGAIEGSLSCNTDQPVPKPPWAGRFPGGYELGGVHEDRVIAEVPALGGSNAVIGGYQKLTLLGAVSPYLRTVLVCPPGPGCDITGGLWVTINNAVYAMAEDIQLEAGEHQVIDLDLNIKELTEDGLEFSIEMLVMSDSGESLNRGLWLRPRIVEFYP